MSNRPFISQPVSEEPSEAAKSAWKQVSESIRKELPRLAFQTWFHPLEPLRFEEGTLTVKVPSRFHYDWIEGHYASQIERSLEEILGKDIRLVYSAESGNGREGRELNAPVYVSDYTTDGGNGKNTNAVDNPTQTPRDANLNPRYVFETFIEGDMNKFARNAAYAVCQAPGRTYNPLLIYGGVGLGKTHLLQAVGHETLKNFPSFRICYITSGRYFQDFVESIKQNRREEFSAKYRAYDVLLLDDIQFLVGRKETQIEFFHAFNTLHQAGKQIVLSSDKPPRELEGLHERLVTRIGWGLVSDIGPPDFDTRVAIAERFAEEKNAHLPQEICSFLAENFTRNIRDLQGAVVRLIAYNSLNGSEITLSLARNVLRDLVYNRERRIPVDLVQQVVGAHFKVPPDLLLAKVRTQPIARARQVAMAISLKLCGLSLKQVGRHFGNRDHTTVLHAKRTVNSWVQKDPQFAAVFDRLVQRVETEAI